jgi:hypothetical protein
MSKEVKVISHKNFARRTPLHITLTLLLMLKVFNAPEWVWGAVGLLVVVLWIAFFYRCATEDETVVNLFDDGTKNTFPKPKNPPPPPKTFEERMAEQKNNGIK